MLLESDNVHFSLIKYVSVTPCPNPFRISTIAATQLTSPFLELSISRTSSPKLMVCHSLTPIVPFPSYSYSTTCFGLYPYRLLSRQVFAASCPYLALCGTASVPPTPTVTCGPLWLSCRSGYSLISWTAR